GIDVCLTCIAPLTFASHPYDDFHLLMPLYLCRSWDGEIEPKEGQQVAWARANRLQDYPMPPADLPLLPIIRDALA
ncbi:MAG: 8-oxo-dGTP diphosphatase MutT, partial [Pseudomonadota bacterium]